MLSLADVLRIHHFHLDRALITELCRLLYNDLRSQIAHSPLLSVLQQLLCTHFHLSDRLYQSGMFVVYQQCLTVFLIENKAVLCCIQYHTVGAISTIHTRKSGRKHKGENLQEWKN